MQKIFFPLLLTVMIFSCTSKSKQENTAEGFNVPDADKKELDTAEKKMFDQITKFGDYWNTDVSGDYITINADGAMQTKTECLADTAHRRVFTGLTETKTFDRKLRKYGDVAIINGRAEFYAGGVNVAGIYYTELWLKKDGKWLFNGWQGTLTKEAMLAMMSAPPKK